MEKLNTGIFYPKLIDSTHLEDATTQMRLYCATEQIFEHVIKRLQQRFDVDELKFELRSIYTFKELEAAADATFRSNLSEQAQAVIRIAYKTARRKVGAQ